MTNDSSTTLWLARHGEVHNPSHVLYGRLPRVRLTEDGRRQAQTLAQYLAGRNLAAVYSSPMLRARRTAESILAAQPNLKEERVRIDRDLHEVGTSWQGQPIDALKRINWDFYANPRSPSDESIQAIAERMLRWINRMVRRHPSQEVVGVSHGDPILIATAALRGLPLERERIFPQPYGIPTGAAFKLCFGPQCECSEVSLVVPPKEVAA